MSKSAERESPHHASDAAHRMFADLRQHNEYAARVARLLDANRKRRIEQVLQLQRKHRPHRAG